MRPLFVVWLVCFYAGWLTLVTLSNRWDTVASHWPIALTMAFGSYVAGSTPMGGGTVAFPILVLLFDYPGSMGRNFGLAIQSIGMTSASIYILSNRQPIDRRLLLPACLGSLIGTPLGAAFVAPIVPDLLVILTFATIWASFGMMTLAKLKDLTEEHPSQPRWHRWDTVIGLMIGLLGGVVASLTGVGIDMILYAVMVLLYRADLKIAIPTSVILMAFTSLVGISTNACLANTYPNRYAIDPEVFKNWLAAAPVVAIGAPFGALVVQYLSRTPTLIIVSLLCIGQFAWTLWHERPGTVGMFGALTGVVAMNLIFMGLWQLSQPPASGRASARRVE